ncbi:hypothetical protein E2C01_051449 [Portunus trituberculatus]|uniref:Uncharacterized protein n=1 Tax=Portunus trituberculatus TaxID=210409 RepID=A0A5B7GIX9_PORTR|nr:hypothetical protein [Portunus trituberculatus]
MHAEFPVEVLGGEGRRGELGGGISVLPLLRGQAGVGGRLLLLATPGDAMMALLPPLLCILVGDLT